MRFLLRMAFWLTVVLVLLPSAGSQPTPKISVGALEAMTAAKATVTDMQSFCERQPEACTVGSQAAVAIGHRAQAGAKILYDYLSEHFGPADGAPATVPAIDKSRSPRGSQNTLSPADLTPAWRGSQPRKEPRGNRPT